MMPKQAELDGAMLALIRLQDTNHLNTRGFAEGRIKGAADTLPMSARDCLELGMYSMNYDYINQANEWIKESLRRVRENEDVTDDLNEMTRIYKLAKEKVSASFVEVKSADNRTILTVLILKKLLVYSSFQRFLSKSFH